MIDAWKIMKPAANLTAKPAAVGEYSLATGRAAAGRLACLHRIYGPGTRELLALAGLRPGMRVADLGCGVGTVTELLAEIVGPTGHVVGVDLSAEQLDEARQGGRLEVYELASMVAQRHSRMPFASQI